MTLAAYLAELHDAVRARRERFAGRAALAPAGERTALVLAGYRRSAGDRGRPHACSVATEVNRQLLGQDLHLLDGDAFHGAPLN